MGQYVLNNYVYNSIEFPFQQILDNAPIVRKKDNEYYNIACAFDIETTSVNIYSEDGKNDVHYGFMYHWQFCIHDTVCFGRTWEEFIDLINRIKEYAGFRTLVIYVHNLAFEFQFIRRFFDFDTMFARDERKPLYCRTDNIEFRCSYFLSNMSLELWTKTTPTCTYYKQSGELYDYKKFRSTRTEMSQNELEYCYCDVRGLCECIESKLIEDTICSIPLTSTGYVRRECRHYVNQNKKNMFLVKRIALDLPQYLLCKDAFRGGDTSGNAWNSGKIIEGMESYDMQSSYPAVIVSEKFPMSKFIEFLPTQEQFFKLLQSKACLMSITFRRIEVKNRKSIPYIDESHCRNVEKIRSYNGRVLSADEITISLTDIDFKIIAKEYIIESFKINKFYYANYGYLPDELRKYVVEMFSGKCRLKIKTNSDNCTIEDEILYGKYKNRINGIFGMMVTDIIRDEIMYDTEWYTDDTYSKQEQLDSHNNNYNTFLAYQWGVWVTAHARLRLRKAIWATGDDCVYVDTDSNKVKGKYKEVFEKLSRENIEKLENCGIDAVVEIDGDKFYLGQWEFEEKHGGINRFVTLGAKKYCTEYKDGKTEITIAGCSKVKGSKYLQDNGGIESFKIGFLFPEEYSGRTTSWYDDSPARYIELDGCRMLTGASVCMDNTTYEIGVTGSYKKYLQEQFAYYLQEY